MASTSPTIRLRRMNLLSYTKEELLRLITAGDHPTFTERMDPDYYRNEKFTSIKRSNSQRAIQCYSLLPLQPSGVHFDCGHFNCKHDGNRPYKRKIKENRGTNKPNLSLNNTNNTSNNNATNNNSNNMNQDNETVQIWREGDYEITSIPMTRCTCNNIKCYNCPVCKHYPIVSPDKLNDPSLVEFKYSDCICCICDCNCVKSCEFGDSRARMQKDIRKEEKAIQKEKILRKCRPLINRQLFVDQLASSLRSLPDHQRNKIQAQAITLLSDRQEVRDHLREAGTDVSATSQPLPLSLPAPAPTSSSPPTTTTTTNSSSSTFSSSLDSNHSFSPSGNKGIGTTDQSSIMDDPFVVLLQSLFDLYSRELLTATEYNQCMQYVQIENRHLLRIYVCFFRDEDVLIEQIRLFLRSAAPNKAPQGGTNLNTTTQTVNDVTLIPPMREKRKYTKRKHSGKNDVSSGDAETTKQLSSKRAAGVKDTPSDQEIEVDSVTEEMQ